MDDHYWINLAEISLEDYRKELESTELLPSRRIIQENLNSRFASLREIEIGNLNDLMNALKKPADIKRLSGETGIPEDYLVVLKREIASLQPKPVNLKDFPDIPEDVFEKLEHFGIRNTKQLFPHVVTDRTRQEFSLKTGLDGPVILELAKLTDLCRIRWVGANFARLLVNSGCDTVKKVVASDYKSLYAHLKTINREKQYFKGMFGENDMKLCVLTAKNVPDVMDF